MTEVAQLPNAAGSGKRPSFWQTQTAIGIGSVIERTRTMADICLITGPSGVGKTTAAITAAKARPSGWPPRLTSYVSMTKSAEGLQAGLLRIATAFGLSLPPHIGAHEAYQALAQRDWEADTVLLLDEAQFMSDPLLHGLRNFWDDLDQRGQAIGIVLIGTPDLSDRINGRSKQRNRDFDPLRGRIGACIALEPITEQDVAAVCRFYGLAGAQTERLIQLVASGPGGLHNVRRLIAQAERLAADKGKLGYSDLKRAAELAGVAS
jgi:type II secretory pathway predicted ATPase ExeA